jgi:hypothetical protein
MGELWELFIFIMILAVAGPPLLYWLVKWSEPAGTDAEKPSPSR